MSKKWADLVSSMRRASLYRPSFPNIMTVSGSRRRESRIDSIAQDDDKKDAIYDLWTLIRRDSTQGSNLGSLGDAKSEVDAFLSHEEDEEGGKTGEVLTREGILEKIRQKKEVIEKLRCQPWSMKRKRKTLRLAQKHLEKHESKVSTRHLYREEMDKKWKKFRRWLANVSIYLIPWENKIKKIESHYGSVVSSYFTFLRWIFWVNFMITLIVTFFIVIPEVLADMGADEERRNKTETRKSLSPEETKTADNIQTLWDYKGFLRVTPLFYGYYSDEERMGETLIYHLPLAYLLVNVFVLAYSFFAILRKMAANARQSKLSSGKGEQYIFNWKLFTGWDYTIGNLETASNTVMSNVNKLREAIAEYRVKLRQKFVFLRFLLRILANLIVLTLIAGSTYLIQYVVDRSKQVEEDPNASSLERNEVPIVVSFITLIFPNLFELVGGLERYHPRTCLRLQLGRILVLYVLNYYTLIIALYGKVEYYEEKQMELLAKNNATLTGTEEMATTTPNYLRYARNADWDTLDLIARFTETKPTFKGPPSTTGATKGSGSSPPVQSTRGHTSDPIIKLLRQFPSRSVPDIAIYYQSKLNRERRRSSTVFQPSLWRTRNWLSNYSINYPGNQIRGRNQIGGNGFNREGTVGSKDDEPDGRSRFTSRPTRHSIQADDANKIIDILEATTSRPKIFYENFLQRCHLVRYVVFRIDQTIRISRYEMFISICFTREMFLYF